MKKVIGVVAALAACGSMLAASAVSGPAELFARAEAQPRQAAVAACADAASDDRQRLGPWRRLMAAVRAFLQRLPFAVKAVIVLPAMAVGRGLLALLSAAAGLVGKAVSPFLSFLGAFLFLFAALLVLFLLLYKKALPQKKLRDFFRRGNLWCIGGGAFLLAVAEKALPKVWPAYPLASAGVQAVLELAVLLLLWRKILSADGSLAFRVRRLVCRGRVLILTAAVAVSAVLRVALTSLTLGTVWSFLPEVVPFGVVALAFFLLADSIRSAWSSRRAPLPAAKPAAA